jgi:hypothetical protein
MVLGWLRGELLTSVCPKVLDPLSYAAIGRLTMNEMTTTSDTDHHNSRRLGDVTVVRRLAPTSPSGVSISFAARCPTCRVKVERSAPIDSPAEFVAQLFRKQGWQISNTCEDLACPICLASRQAERRGKKEKTKLAHDPAQILATAKLHRLLIERFKPETGHYDADWDDARVAAECGLDEEQVAEVREAAYGSIKPRVDPALTALQRELGELKAWAAKEHGDMREMLDSWLKDADTKLYELSKAVDAALTEASK